MRRTCYFASALILFFGIANTVLADNDNGAPSTLGMSFEQVKQAAAQGDPDAEYALGYMYYYGKDGAVRDLISAKMWIEKAAAQGQPQAIKAAQLLGIADHPRQGGSTIKPQVDRLVQSAQTEPKKPAVASAKVSNHAMNQQRLLKAPSHYYTVQLLGAFNKQDITNFVNQHHLQAKTAVYKTYFHEKPWYVLIYGIYATDAAAEAAIKKLPTSIRKLDPWVKSLASVHDGIKEGAKKDQHLAANHSSKKYHKSLAKNNRSNATKKTITANNDASNNASTPNDNASQANDSNQAANASDVNPSNTAQNTANDANPNNSNQMQARAANPNDSAQNANASANNQPQQPGQMTNNANAANSAAPDQMQQNSMASEDTY